MLELLWEVLVVKGNEHLWKANTFLSLIKSHWQTDGRDRMQLWSSRLNFLHIGKMIVLLEPWRQDGGDADRFADTCSPTWSDWLLWWEKENTPLAGCLLKMNESHKMLALIPVGFLNQSVKENEDRLTTEKLMMVTAVNWELTNSGRLK